MVILPFGVENTVPKKHSRASIGRTQAAGLWRNTKSGALYKEYPFKVSKNDRGQIDAITKKRARLRNCKA